MRKGCDTLDTKEDLFGEEELATVLKGLKNNKAPGADSIVNEFLQYGSSEVQTFATEDYEYDFSKGRST